ncbi:MAG TPA: RnfH family protein [Burkholderiaceae bacterium]|nr:RnfH family protein [Burkholderiaceae bacterium]HRA79028.1 RnfH family protein [Burkholderiaceae bacterium]
MAADDDAWRRTVIAVEIAWVETDGSVGRHALELPAGACVRDALAALRGHDRCGALLDRLASGDLTTAIYGERCDAASTLHPGDRIELLAGLAVDPKLARRLRAGKRRGGARGAG